MVPQTNLTLTKHVFPTTLYAPVSVPSPKVGWVASVVHVGVYEIQEEDISDPFKFNDPVTIKPVLVLIVRGYTD